MNAGPFAVVERTDLAPLCPHCGEALAEVYSRGTGVPLGAGKTVVFFCPHCRKVLGFGQERMI